MRMKSALTQFEMAIRLNTYFDREPNSITFNMDLTCARVSALVKLTEHYVQLSQLAKEEDLNILSTETEWIFQKEQKIQN